MLIKDFQTATFRCTSPTVSETLTASELVSRLSTSRKVYYSIPVLASQSRPDRVVGEMEPTTTAIQNVFVAGGEIQRSNETYTVDN